MSANRSDLASRAQSGRWIDRLALALEQVAWPVAEDVWLAGTPQDENDEPKQQRPRNPGPAATLQRLLPWMIPMLMLAGWQVASMLDLLSSQVVPAPASVAVAGWHLAQSGQLWADIRISTWRALTGFAIGGGFGFALGLMNGLSRTSETLTDSTLQMVRNVPHLALIPLVILWFGIGEEAKIFLVTLGVFFPMYVNTQHGVRGVDPHLLEMARAYGMSRTEMFFSVVLPGALPSIFVGLRYGLGIMWLTLIVAETIAASSGIGFMAMTAREFMQVDVVVFSILIYAALGKLADSVARLLERSALSWNPSYART